MGAPGPSQLRVRETMLDAGGYWRPLAALARLLEELGELSELLGEPAGERDELAGELADLWIITAALGDQYLASVAEPGLREQAPGTSSPLALIAGAGVLARVVNHYDGPKRPRGGLPSLAASLDAFHHELRLLAKGLEVDLGDAVEEKLAAIRARGDLSRFARGDYDPSTAPVLERYRARAGEGRVWGAPELSSESIARAAEAVRPALVAFAKVAAPERLDGFVIGLPSTAETGWADALLDALGLAQNERIERAPAPDGFVLLRPSGGQPGGR